MAEKRVTKAQVRIAEALLGVGCALLTAGLWLPPLGEIHPSILVAFGEILTWAGAAVGLDYHYKYKTDELEHRMKNMMNNGNGSKPDNGKDETDDSDTGRGA